MNIRDGHSDAGAMRAAANALVDFTTFSKGRALFRKKNKAEIETRRNMLLADDPRITHIGAYQRSLKELWEGADQDRWEDEAAVGEGKDIYE